MILTYISISLSAGIWLYFIYRYDRFEPEPVRLVIFIGIAGGFLSALPSAFFNTAFSAILGIGNFIAGAEGAEASVESVFLFSVAVGLNEEIWKSFVAVMILKRIDEFNEPIDALIYSMSIALGFAAFENVSYTVAGGLGVLFVRSLTAVPLHAGLASIWGSGIARAKFNKNGRYFTTVFPYVIASALIHAIYNYIQLVNPDSSVSFIIALIFVFLIISYASSRLKYFERESPFRRSGLCPQCGTLNGIFARYCKECGSYIVTDFYSLCSACGARNRKGLSSCRHCGDQI